MPVTNNNEMTEGARVLFALVFNRISREKQMTPKYIGRFAGVAALPRGIIYPATYFWVNTSFNAFVFSVNDPLLRKWAQQESDKLGLTFFDGEVTEAIKMIKTLSGDAFFQSMVNVLPPPERMPPDSIDFS